MSHCCLAVIYFEDDTIEIDDILDHHSGYAFDYYQKFEEYQESEHWYDGLILKKGVENEHTYNTKNGTFAYKAKIEDVDWRKTFAEGDISKFANPAMVVDEYDFFNKKKLEIERTQFNNFVKRMLERGDTVELVDIHE